jgi:hypothetical protein
MRPKAADLERDVLATFQGWLPVLHETTRVHVVQSFPSAHTATAFGLATVLSWKYPRGAAMFYLLAAFAGFQRVQVMDHFTSDVLCGAAVGLLCGAACVHQRLAGGRFDRLESQRRNLPSGKQLSDSRMNCLFAPPSLTLRIVAAMTGVRQWGRHRHGYGTSGRRAALGGRGTSAQDER